MGAMRTNMLKRIVAALVLFPAYAGADIPPPPGAAEAYRRDLIRQAGHACDDPVVLRAATSAQEEEYRAKGLQAQLARCGNGKAYLVATPPRRPPPPNSSPRPEPVVVPME
jgi:hypothetical protein